MWLLRRPFRSRTRARNCQWLNSSVIIDSACYEKDESRKQIKGMYFDISFGSLRVSAVESVRVVMKAADPKVFQSVFSSTSESKGVRGTFPTYCYDEWMRDFIEEAEKQLVYSNHPNLVRFFGLILAQNTISLIYEDFEGACPLISLLPQSSWTWSGRWRLALELARAIQHLHEVFSHKEPITLHGHVRAGRVFLRHDNVFDECATVKLDTVARFLTCGSVVDKETSKQNDIHALGLLMQEVATITVDKEEVTPMDDKEDGEPETATCCASIDGTSALSDWKALSANCSTYGDEELAAHTIVRAIEDIIKQREPHLYDLIGKWTIERHGLFFSPETSKVVVTLLMLRLFGGESCPFSALPFEVLAIVIDEIHRV